MQTTEDLFQRNRCFFTRFPIYQSDRRFDSLDGAWQLQHHYAFLACCPTWLNKYPGVLCFGVFSVSKYDIKIGVLTLEHNYSEARPRPSGDSASSINVVEVDANVVLDGLTRADVQVGAWLNVFGYVRERAAQEAKRRHGRPPIRHNSSRASGIYIDAVMVLSAGAIHVGEYERVLRDAQEADRRVNRPQ